MRLSEPTEEVATFYGKMLDHDYTTKEAFNKNFFKDWRRVMTEKEKEKIRDLSKCDFQEINVYFKKVSEDRKNRSKEEKKAEKAKNDELTEHYGFCEIDGHKEKIGNVQFLFYLLTKKIVKLCLHLTEVVQISLQYDEIFHKKQKIANFTSAKNYEKIRQTLFTSRLHSAELLSFWRDFSQKILNSNFTILALKRHLVAILGVF